MRRALLGLALLAAPAAWAANAYYDGTPLSAVSASANQTSSAIETTRATSCSFEVIWASLTGTLDGEFQVQVSNDNSTWTDKASATVTVSGASSNDMISLNGVVSEKFYRIKWTKNNVSGGTVTSHAICKG